MESVSSPGLPPSGLWSGHYFYGSGGAKHQMRMALTFTPDGKISGDGIDDVAPFTINGLLNVATNETSWIKAYVGMHSVEYRGLYDLRSICGTWFLMRSTGGFWIWPDGIGRRDELQESVEEPVETELVRAPFSSHSAASDSDALSALAGGKSLRGRHATMP